MGLSEFTQRRSAMQCTGGGHCPILMIVPEQIFSVYLQKTGIAKEYSRSSTNHVTSCVDGVKVGNELKIANAVPPKTLEVGLSCSAAAGTFDTSSYQW